MLREIDRPIFFSSRRRTSEFFSDPVDLQLDYWINEGNNNSNSAGAESSSHETSHHGHHAGHKSGHSASGSGSKRDSYHHHHKGKDDSKSSIKTSIRYMVIQKSLSGGITLEEPAASGNAAGPAAGGVDPRSNSAFTMQYWVKEKKPKSEFVLVFPVVPELNF